jgi:hypothetical protein
MRLAVLDQYAKGLVHCDAVLGEEIREKIARLKWALWHGNLSKALSKIEAFESLIYNFEEMYPKFKQMPKAVAAFRTYIGNNSHLIPNYGERYRHSEAIATGFVAATVHQVVSKRFCKRQQMQWSKRGVHLLRQTRVKTLNRELGAVYKGWDPAMEVEELAEAAYSPTSPCSLCLQLVQHLWYSAFEFTMCGAVEHRVKKEALSCE